MVVSHFVVSVITIVGLCIGVAGILFLSSGLFGRRGPYYLSWLIVLMITIPLALIRLPLFFLPPFTVPLPFFASDGNISTPWLIAILAWFVGSLEVSPKHYTAELVCSHEQDSSHRPAMGLHPASSAAATSRA